MLGCIKDVALLNNIFVLHEECNIQDFEARVWFNT